MFGNALLSGITNFYYYDVLSRRNSAQDSKLKTNSLTEGSPPLSGSRRAERGKERGGGGRNPSVDRCKGGGRGGGGGGGGPPTIDLYGCDGGGRKIE